MKRASTSIAMGMVSLSLFCLPGGHGAASAAVPLDQIGMDPAIPLPGDNPCGACSYDVVNKRFSGSLDTAYTAHAYPLTSMTLKLYNSFGGLLAGPLTLTPTSAYGGQDMAQTLSTSVTSGVAIATFSFHTADGYNLSQNVTVQ